MDGSYFSIMDQRYFLTLEKLSSVIRRFLEAISQKKVSCYLLKVLFTQANTRPSVRTLCLFLAYFVRSTFCLDIILL